MKTQMQEHIEWLKNERTRYINKAHQESSEQMLGFVYKIDDCIKHAESMLEKEQETMCEFAYKCHKKHKVYGDFMIQDYYNETFNTKEK